MTIAGKLNLLQVCPTQLVVAVEWMEDSSDLTTARSSRKPQFNNQVSVKFGSKSVKMFRNGSVHVTGCKTVQDFVDAITAVCEAMTLAGIGAVVEVVSFDVVMINVTFSAAAALGLRDLRDKGLAKGWTASYDADVYPGLNLKIPVDEGTATARNVTALIFRSGNIILTGARTPSQVVEAHTRLMSLVAGQ